MPNKNIAVFKTKIANGCKDIGDIVFYSYRTVDQKTNALSQISAVNNGMKYRLMFYVETSPGYLDKIYSARFVELVEHLKNNKNDMNYLVTTLVDSFIPATTEEFVRVCNADGELHDTICANARLVVKGDSYSHMSPLRGLIPVSRDYTSIEEMCNTYKDLLERRGLPKGNSYYSKEHLINMLDNIHEGVDSGLKYGKWMRWLGYVQGVMVMGNILCVDEERNRSRTLLTKLDDQFDNK